MNTLLMFVIMGLVYRFKAPEGGFRIFKFDLLYKYLEHGHTHSANQCPAFRCSIFHKLSSIM